MSFFLPTENEQIQLVDNFEAESAQAPFAFLYRRKWWMSFCAAAAIRLTIG